MRVGRKAGGYVMSISSISSCCHIDVVFSVFAYMSDATQISNIAPAIVGGWLVRPTSSHHVVDRQADAYFGTPMTSLFC